MKTNDKDIAKTKKIAFMNYFDGFYDLKPADGTSNTYIMGVCKLDYNSDDNTLTVFLRRPGLLIGYHGETINAVEKYLECTIKIVEINLLENTL